MRSLIQSLLTVAMLILASQAHAQSLTRDGMLDFVVQWTCLDQQGGLTNAIPVDGNCVRHRLQTASDPAGYRKYDWTNDAGTAGAPGLQASDSVVQSRAGRKIVIQTFDGGADGGSFGQFDAAQGDGGQVLLLTAQNWLSFAMTEGGGADRRWFIGEKCGRSTSPDDRYEGRLAFHSRTDASAWNSVVARVTGAASPDACPRQFGDVFTRYRRDRIVLPFRITPIDGPPVARWQALDTIVSEQFAGASASTAGQMERFYFARSLGLVRWERWTNGTSSQPSGKSGGCPVVERYGAPGPQWLLSDCRMWTALAAQRGIWKVDDYRLPGLDDFGPIDAVQ